MISSSVITVRPVVWVIPLASGKEKVDYLLQSETPQEERSGQRASQQRDMVSRATGMRHMIVI